MTYEQALAAIAALEPRGWRLGLDRMQEFINRAGLTDSVGSSNDPKYIHVAGTNGKGSTTAFLQSLLVEAGYRTGAFFSPYVVDPRERVQFGRELIGKQELADLTEELLLVTETFTDSDFGGITEFEFKTAIGFLYWKRKACEWVALEVGLGGRLDATNVVMPRASIIVSIGMDHMNILGDTRAKIAFEKAGIIKPDIPVILGEMADEAKDVILSVSKELRAPVWQYGKEIFWDAKTSAVETPNGYYPGLAPSLVGPIQTHNLSLAVAALDAAGAITTTEALVIGARSATIPGRFQEVTYQGKTVIFDGAHNPDAAEVLLAALDADDRFESYVLVTNMLSGHDPSEFYNILKRRVSKVHVVPIDFHRAKSVGDMVTKLAETFDLVKGHPSSTEGLEAAIDSTGHHEAVLVTGSFYLVGQLLREI